MITAIIRQENEYFTYHEWVEFVNKSVVLPVYTSVGMSGKINTSRNERKLHTTQQKKCKVKKQCIGEKAAKFYVNKFPIKQVERLGENNWVVRF